MTTGNGPTPRVSLLHGLPLTVFAVDGSLGGRGTGHQVGALAMAGFFAWLLVGELISARRSYPEPSADASDDSRAAASAGSAPAPTAIPSR